MIGDVIQAKLNEAQEALENATLMGWSCDVFTEQYPVRVVFRQNQPYLLAEENQACITFTFTAKTNTAIIWDSVDVKEVKKLKDMAEEYADIFYKWFFMKNTLMFEDDTNE